MAGFRAGAFLAALAGVSAFAPLPLLKTGQGCRQREQMRMSLDDVSESRQEFLRDSAVGLAAGAIAVGASTGASPPAEAGTNQN